MTFEKLGLIGPLVETVGEEGYAHPTAIQEQAIGYLLEGRDLMGCAQTGTGKTAAFALPILQRLHDTEPTDQKRRVIRALVLTPTRELAVQIGDSFETYGRRLKLRCATVYGGIPKRKQRPKLQKGVDILVATPGRLLDFLGDRAIKLDRVEVFVLDEADRMLDMGFIPDVRRILRLLPGDRQTLLFSATIPTNVQRLGDSILRDPVLVSVAPEAPAADTVDQWVYLVERGDKQALLEHLLTGDEVTRALIFSRTKKGADRLQFHLQLAKVDVDVLHSDKTQVERRRTLEKFKAGKTRVLVASDIAARGLDIDDVSHVINFDMPEEADTYVHRIGRTGRAGKDGKALSFCGIEERAYLAAIERLIDRKVPTVEDHPFPSAVPRRARRPAATRLPRSWSRLGRGRRR